MANTVIQLKFSNITATPTSLNVGEPAYSYTSNTLFIGTPGSDGAIAIGGKFFLDQQQIIFNTANAAFASANNSTKSNSAFDQANAAFEVANSAAIAANTPSHVANSAAIYANGAFTAANTADSKAVSAGSYANSAFVHANSSFIHANSSFDHANAGFTVANTAEDIATAAFIRANNSVNANTGGTIDGNLTITGNLNVIGNTVSYNVSTYVVNDPIVLFANNNYSDIVDIGFAAHYSTNSVDQLHTGLVRHAATDKYYLFEGYGPHLLDDNILDVNDPSLVISTLRANIESDLVTIGGVDIKNFTNNAYNHANAAFGAANTADSKAVTAGSYANSAFLVANSATTSVTAAFNHANSSFDAANTADGKAVTAGSYANSAFSLANGTAGIANTDYTTISTTAGNYGIVTGGFAYIPGFTLEANGRISQANSTLLQVDTSMITSGTFSVARGGTGANTFTTNGVLLGQGTSAFTTASSSTEGHVLTINNSGVPTFAHLQGGTF
jgi:hypothetical protein